MATKLINHRLINRCFSTSGSICSSTLPNRHRDPLWRKARSTKVIRIDLPDVQLQKKALRLELSPEEQKEFLKLNGLSPAGSDNENEVPSLYIGSCSAILDSYVPKEGDAKASFFSKEGGKDTLDFTKGKGKSVWSVRKVRAFDHDFTPKSFPTEATDVYIKANQALMTSDQDEILKYFTEYAYPLITHGLKNKTIRWKFLESLEPPRVVHVRTQDLMQKKNTFAQVTVRLFTKQTLAIYDRFGRLIQGSETVAKDVLEYVVFEKHLANTYGTWRVHAKIIPDWMPHSVVSKSTFVLDEEDPDTETTPTVEADKKDEEITEKDMEESVFDRFGRKIKT